MLVPGAAEWAQFEFSAPGSPRDQEEFWSYDQDSEPLQNEGIFSLLNSTEGWMERPKCQQETLQGFENTVGRDTFHPRLLQEYW